MRKHNTAQLVELDGCTLEGGGQLIRNAVCLSALTGTPLHIHNIRGNRGNGGGLRAQHLACVNWLAHASSAKIDGAQLVSKTLTFEPAKASESAPFMEHSPAFKKIMRNGEPIYDCRIDIGTAGSTGLALQAILPFILFSKLPSHIPTHLTLIGGTNQAGAPSYDYIDQVLLPTLQRIGFPAIEARLEKRGWHASTLGSFTLVIPPRDAVALPAFRLSKCTHTSTTKPRPSHLRATFIAPQASHKACKEGLLTAIDLRFGEGFLIENGNLEISCESSGHDKRMYLIVVATVSPDPGSIDDGRPYTFGADCLEEGKIRSHAHTAKEMVDTVTRDLADDIASGAAVDFQMRDQLVIFEALAHGTSEVYGGEDDDGDSLEPSLHTRTAEWVAKKMLKVTFDADGRCEGFGFGAT